MNIGVKINPISMEGSILATASINLDQCLAVRNVHPMNGRKSMFLSISSYRTGDGEFRDICPPITTEFRTQMTKTLTSAYKEAPTIQQSKMTQMAESLVSQMAPTGLPM